MREQRNLRIMSVGERNAGVELRGPPTRSRWLQSGGAYMGQGAERAEQGLPLLFNKYYEKQTRNYVRARYKVDPVTKELTTDPKTKALELVLVRNTPPRN